MFPSAATALSMGTVDDLIQHFGVSTELWQAFTQETGSPGNDLRLLAALPGSAVAAALSQAQLPSEVPLTAVQAAHVGLVWKLARKIMYTKGGGAWDN